MILFCYSPIMKSVPLKKILFHKFVLSVSICVFSTLFFTACDSHQDTETEHKRLDFNPAQWPTIEESSLGFRGKFPGKWKFEVQFMKTEKGAATVYIFDYWHLAFQYGITVVRFPPGIADSSNPKKVLDYAVQSLAEEQQGIISHQQSITVAGFPARRAVLRLPESRLKNTHVNTIIILRDNLVYRVTTAGLGNVDYVDFFFKSFELIPIEPC